MGILAAILSRFGVPEQTAASDGGERTSSEVTNTQVSYSSGTLHMFLWIEQKVWCFMITVHGTEPRIEPVNPKPYPNSAFHTRL